METTIDVLSPDEAMSLFGLGDRNLKLIRDALPVNLSARSGVLKIVGRQVAGHLAQQQASERLAEGRQFQAYNRLTAFLMHDLKNLVAQQSLVVRNATQHKDNPEFFDDAINTIANSVARMKRLISQLAQRDRKDNRAAVDVAAVLAAVVDEVGDRTPQPQITECADDILVLADRDRMQQALFQEPLRLPRRVAAADTNSVSLSRIAATR